MEYIDGEDLSSLMKRIGSLTNEKALDIARQLVAGLTVAHERGVLHRDLKPANIMLDGHGRVRITDFGLAIAVGDGSQSEEIAGTPAYMAPEQLAGKGATVRSDIYSLGLILYEIYTGKKAFKAQTLAELREQKETQTPRAPSEIREGIDPVVERVIQRCMEKDPASRPASVAQLAQALPGGDPLAAAIAAGETPSPEMVAASGGKEGLRPLVAWGLLLFIVVGILVFQWLGESMALHERIPFKEPPEVLVNRSQEIIERAGYTEEIADKVYGFIQNDNLLRYIDESGKTADRWEKLDEKAILFWYRQSPRSLGFSVLESGETGLNNPSMQHPGEALVILDTVGHLVSFEIIPSKALSPSDNAVPFDWEIFFDEADLVYGQWKHTDPRQAPSIYADTLDAWEGTLPNWLEAPARIEAAAFQGKPVRFSISGPWDLEGGTESTQNDIGEQLEILGWALVLLLAIVGGIFFDRRNIRLGRGDRRNAKRLAIFVLIWYLLVLVFRLPEISFNSFLFIPYLAGLTWIIYIAIEPYARRQWPQILISWTRLLSREWKDPLVARDILYGCAAGVLYLLILFCSYLIPVQYFFAGLDQPYIRDLSDFKEANFFISNLLTVLFAQTVLSLFTLCALIVARVLLRSQTAAIIVCILSMVLATAPTYGYVAALLAAILWYFVLMRISLVAAIFTILAAIFCSYSGLSVLTDTWYSGYGFTSLAIFAVIVLYALYYSLGGRPVFGTPRLDE